MGLPNEVISGLFGAAKDEDAFQVSRSLRFNSADSAYLSRTSVTSDRQKFTWSFWTKITSTANMDFISAKLVGTGSYPNMTIQILSNVIRVWDYTGAAFNINLYTTQVFRDYSAWYHIVLGVDTTQATAANRVRLYINGNEITSFSTATYPAQNTSLTWGTGSLTNVIGAQAAGGPAYANCYMSEVYLIDGQQLTPSSFGQTDVNGRWVPKSYTGTYGTQGAYLKFADNSGTTATTLGKDSSGNGNNWTPTNFSVTAGVGNDSLVDSPTNYGTDTGLGGEVRGNYATWNPIDLATGITIADGSLKLDTAATSGTGINNFGMTSGKWYCEITPTLNGNYCLIGIIQALAGRTSWVGSNSLGYSYSGFDGTKYNNNSAVAYGTAYATNDVIGIAFDADNGRIFFSKNGVWQNSSSPTAGTNAAYTSLTNGPYFIATSDGSNGIATTVYANFGQRPFAYTAPTGFKALCTQNLPTPAIKKPSQYMNIVTYTGTGATRSITGVGFQPDLVWTEARGASTEDGLIVDSTRGATKRLMPCFTYTEATESGITSFDTDGFTINGTTDTGYNTNAVNYVGWCWKLGATPGFDIRTYRGTGGSRTFTHNLGVAPRVMIVKSRTNGTNWTMYHASLGAGGAIFPNTTGAYFASSSYWNNTAPTSTVFSLGSAIETNQSPQDFVNYLWAEVDGFSRFRSYTGNASTDGPFVWCGFRPKWIMIKLNGTGNWWIYDTSRSTTNPAINKIINTISTAEDTSGEDIDILSNGFKLRTTDATLNGSGTTHIFMAFAETPFKYSRGR